jgi:hypothetical protein
MWQLLKRAPEAILDHGIDHFPIAHALAVARFRQDVRRQTHVFLTAGDHDAGIAALHGLRRQMHGLQTAAADLVDGQRRNVSGRPPASAAWRAAFWPDARLEHLTEDDLVDLSRLQIGARRARP